MSAEPYLRRADCLPEILEALPGHPVATRLRFENPLTTFRDSL